MTIAALSASFLCTGCVSFLDAELNNRGGYSDTKLDNYWMIADTKQMRALRAYTLIGSLARMSRENYYKSERKLLANHVNVAVNAAHDAYVCAYARPGDCVYFDERMAELEIATLRLAVAVFSQHENETLFSVITKNFNDTMPLLEGLNTLTKVLDAFTTSAQLTASAGKLVQSLLTFGQTAYGLGRRAGALYRDSIELEMIAVLGSLDAQCSWGSNEFLKLDRTAKGTELFYTVDSKSRSWDERLTYQQFYGENSTETQPCRALELGLEAWNKGSGDLSAWKKWLDATEFEYRQTIIPNERAFIQASDLIWRACDQITEGEDSLATCLGHRGTKATNQECGITKDGQFYVSKKLEELGVKTGSELRKELNDLFRAVLNSDQCRLILYAKTFESRLERRSEADARLSYLSDPISSPANR